jgi:hypothetical protein
VRPANQRSTCSRRADSFPNYADLFFVPAFFFIASSIARFTRSSMLS